MSMTPSQEASEERARALSSKLEVLLRADDAALLRIVLDAIDLSDEVERLLRLGAHLVCGTAHELIEVLFSPGVGTVAASVVAREDFPCVERRVQPLLVSVAAVLGRHPRGHHGRVGTPRVLSGATVRALVGDHR
jgi:hypothetical protein